MIDVEQTLLRIQITYLERELETIYQNYVTQSDGDCIALKRSFEEQLNTQSDLLGMFALYKDWYSTVVYTLFYKEETPTGFVRVTDIREEDMDEKLPFD